jgi:hypothetical protein
MQNPGDNEIQSGPDNDDRMSAEKQRRILPLERRASVGDEFHFFKTMSVTMIFCIFEMPILGPAQIPLNVSIVTE